MIIALIIIAILAWFFLAFRAYACFNLIVIGFSLFFVGCYGADSFFRTSGLLMMLTGAAILFITSLRVERSMRVSYMIRLFLYGMALFLRLILIMMIIGIPLAKLFSIMAANYREMIVVDCYGNDTGRRVVVNEDTMRTVDGIQYDRYDPY